MKNNTIIFDLDGTLIDSSEGIVAAFNHALKKFGLPQQPPEKITPMIGFPVETMFGQFTTNSLNELKSAFRTKAMETVVNASRPLPGAEAAIISLFEDGYKLGIATTKIRSHIDGILEKLGWVDFFEAVIGGDEVSNVKPHPEQFEQLLKKMNSQIESSVVVGDTVNDVLAAKATGVRVVAVCSPYGGEAELRASQPDYVIDKISQLPFLLNNGNPQRKEPL